jgi:hypothetical protein
MKNKKLQISFFALALSFFWIGWGLIWLVVSSEDITHGWLVFAVFLLALVAFGMFVILTKETKAAIFLAGLCLLGFVVLGFGSWFLVILSIFVCWTIFCLGVKRIKDEQHNKVKMNIYITLRRGISAFGLALSLLICVGFYIYLVEKQEISTIPTINIEIPQEITNRAINIADFFAPEQNFSLISEGVTVDEYLERTLTGGEADHEKSLLVAQNKSALLAEGRSMLSKQFRIELSGEEKMNEVINTMFEKRVSEIFNGQVSDAPLLPFGAAAALFVVVSSIFWFLGFLVIWTSVILFYILLRLQVVAVNKESREVEVVD